MIRLRFRPRPGMVCRQAVELVTDYLEGVLPQGQRRRFEAHLASCNDCPEYLAQIRTVITLAGSVTADNLTPLVDLKLMGVYRRWLADEG